MKHTPGPWTVRFLPGSDTECFVEAPKLEGQPYSCEILGDDYGAHGDEEQRVADCKFIVLSCNNHEVLVEALKRMVKCQHLMMQKANHKESAWDAECITEMNEAPIQAKKAIADLEKL